MPCANLSAIPPGASLTFVTARKIRYGSTLLSNQQNVNPAVVAGVPEYLMCDSTPFPGASGCGFSFAHSALDSAINLRQNAWDSTYFGGGAQGPCTWPTWDPFTSMCVSNDNDACLAQQQEHTANEAGWRSSCATMKSRGDDVLVVSILQLHAQHLQGKTPQLEPKRCSHKNPRPPPAQKGREVCP